MLIECTLPPRRDGAQQSVTLDAIVYTFAPNEKGYRVALVTREEHIERLLAPRMAGAYIPHTRSAQLKREIEELDRQGEALKAEAEALIARRKALADAYDVEHEKELAEGQAYVDAAAEEEERKAEEEAARKAARQRVSEKNKQDARRQQVLAIQREDDSLSEADAERELTRRENAEKAPPAAVAKDAEPKASTSGKGSRGTAAAK